MTKCGHARYTPCALDHERRTIASEPSKKAKLSGEGLMRTILFFAAAFITCVTALSVFAQSPGAPPITSNQQYVQRDGKWMVCVGGECKPLSKKACMDNYNERAAYLIKMYVKLQGDGHGMTCGPFDGFEVLGLIDEVMLENYFREKVCLEFAEQQGAPSGRQRAKRPAKSSASSSSKTLGKSSLSAPATKGSNTGVMNRLSGDSQLPNLSHPSSMSGEGNRLVPARGGASTVAKPVNNTPAPSPTIDFGNCASCGRSPSPPR
jgi:hypothetical protein